jgi:SH3-like domain-containing protein
MNQAVQNTLNELSAKCDRRVSVFDVKITGLTGETLSLSGRLLEASQVSDLRRIFSNLKLETESINILNRTGLPRYSVATNLTGVYESPTFGMPLSSELYFGTELEVLEEQGRWVFTRQKDGYLGWVYKPYLMEATRNETHLVLAASVEMHSEPDQASLVLTRLVSGTGVLVEETHGDWVCVVTDKSGWIPTHALRAIQDIPEAVEEKRKLLVEDAHRMIGTPYLWGGASGNGIDCSGYARLLHRWVGIQIPRDADMQCNAAKPVEGAIQVGDLLFFGEGESERHVTHVGVSLGDWRMIHSSRSHNGVYVDDVQQRESLKDIYVSAGSFLR